MTEQEEFWNEKFGEDYHKRNVELVQNNTEMLRKIFDMDFDKYHYYMTTIKSIIEFGAGTGENTQALRNIFKDACIHGLELFSSAADKLKDNKSCNVVHNQSIFDFDSGEKFDLVMTRGLLIHISPDDIDKAYTKIYDASKKYILMCEYYNPTLVEVSYRGHAGKLWKRDFAGNMLDMYKDMSLIDYGFCYNRPSRNDKHVQDSVTWFLLEKQ